MNYIKVIVTVFLLCLFGVRSKAQISVYGAVDHIVPDGIDTQGGIKLTVSGSTAPYTYTWSPGSYTTQNVSSLTAGQYSVNVLSASSQTYQGIYNIGYKVAWTNFDRCFLRNDSLISQAANTNIYGMAASKNTLPASTDGWFEFVVPDVTSTARYFIGFVDSLGMHSSYSDIDYGVFYHSTKSLYYYEGGTNYNIIKTTPKVGDVVRVERVSNTINYKINNVTVRTVTVTGVGAKTFKLKASFNSNPARLINVGCSFMNLGGQNFKGYVDAKTAVKHVSVYGGSDGYAKAIPRISFTNTYTWQPSGVNTQTTGALSAGTITLTIADSLLNSSTYKYDVGYRADWTNLDRCVFRNDSLITQGTNGNIYGTANSRNTLDAGVDGWMEFTLHNLSGNTYYVGFTDRFNAIPNSGGEIVAGFGLSAGNIIYYEGGSSGVIFYYPKVGDRLRIERTGNSFIYKLNGITLRTITNTSYSAKVLKLKVLLLNTNYLANVGCSFYNKSNATFDNYVLLNPIIKHASNTMSSDGSIKPNPELPFANTYTWQPGGATTNSISSLPAGAYTVTVKDSLNNKSTYKLKLGYKVQWTNVDQATFRNDSIFTTSTNTNVIGSAVSKNTLPANTNGWLEYRVLRLNDFRYYIGLTDSVRSLQYQVTDIDYGFYYTANILNSYDNNTTTIEDYNLKAGDLLSISRSNDTIYYRVNDLILKALYVPNVSQRAFKIKTNLYQTDAFVDVGCSFTKSDSVYMANYVQLIPEVTHAGSTTTYDGNIKVTPRIAASNTYTWFPGGSNSNIISNLTKGSYTVKVSDNRNNSSYAIFNSGYKVNWTALYNANIGGDTLRSTVTTTSSACSKDTLMPGQNGWVEYVYTESASKSFRFGFLDLASGTQSAYTDIDYGYYFNGAGILYQQENSTNTVFSYNFRKGDVFRLERSGDTLKYIYNGFFVRYTVASGLSSRKLLIKAVLYNKAKLAKLGASFSYCSYTVSATASQSITCSSPSAILTGTTNMPSPSYTWIAGGSTPNSYTTSISAPGTYTLKVSNSSGCVAQTTLAVAGATATAVTIEASTMPTSGLNAYWPFNGNANDASGNANNGTVASASLTTDRFGNPGKAYYFNGTTSRIDVPNSITVDMPDGQDYSISFWMKAKAGNTDAIPVSKNVYGGWSGYMFFANSTNGGYCNTPGHGSFYVAAGGGGDACSDGPIYNDTTNWYFITGQYKASTNQVFLYVNSSLQADIGTASGFTSNTKPLTFGAYNDGDLGYFHGALDDIRFYNRLLTQNEINTLYNEPNPLSSPAVSCTSPVVRLKASATETTLTYTWTPEGSSPSASVTNVSVGGNYTVAVTNTLTGCITSSTIHINSKLCATATMTDYINPSSKGIVNLSISGGTAPYNIAWNSLKLDTPNQVYNQLKDSLAGIDSVAFKNYISNLRQKTYYTDLEPGTYSVTVYDQANDSISLSISLGQKITSPYALSGISGAINDPVSDIVKGGIHYNYGKGAVITQSGTFSPGNHFCVLPSRNIDFAEPQEISFVIRNSNDIAYVGFFKDTVVCNGDTADMNRKTMFRFNGNGTFDIILLGNSIYNGIVLPGDQFALRTSEFPGKITYYKNEVQLAMEDVTALNSSSNTGFMTKMILGSSGAVIGGIKIKFPKVILSPPIKFPICSFISALFLVTASATPNFVCAGGTTNLSGQLNDLSSAPVTLSSSAYLWQPGSITGPTPSPVTLTATQIFTLNVSYGGCVLKKTVSVNVSNLTANAGPDKILNTGNVQIGAVNAANLGSPPYSYNWSPNSNFSAGSSNIIPRPYVEPTNSLLYTLTVTDANSCTATDQVYVTVLSTVISYAVPSRVIDAGFYSVYNNKLYFKFEEEYRTSVLNYRILDYDVTTLGSSPAQVICTNLTSTAKSLGDNRYYIDIPTCGSLATSRYYLVEITNDKNEKFYLKFKI